MTQLFVEKPALPQPVIHVYITLNEYTLHLQISSTPS